VRLGRVPSTADKQATFEMLCLSLVRCVYLLSVTLTEVKTDFLCIVYPFTHSAQNALFKSSVRTAL